MTDWPTGKMGDVPDCWPVYASFDPGVTTGVTLWTEAGKPIHYNELDITNLHNLLDCLEVYASESTVSLKQIIVEEYRLYQRLALQQSGSKLETVQVIGMIKRSNYKMGLPPVAEVRADNKEIASQWSGMAIPRKKTTHLENWKAAYLVGYWWLHTNGVIPARVLDTL